MSSAISPERIFWLHGGRAIKDLSDLVLAFAQMDSVTFSHHVTSYKNDFATWVSDVLHDDTLATRLRSTRKKEVMHTHALTALSAQEAQDHVFSATQFLQLPRKESQPQEPIKTVAPAIASSLQFNEDIAPVKRLFRSARPFKEKVSDKISETKEQTVVQKRIVSDKVTPLVLSHVFATAHYSYKHVSLITLVSYLALGVVTGVAIAVLLLAGGL